MAYPDKDTAEFWELVASGYRQLAEHPPKFMAPGSTVEGFMQKAKEAEAKAESVRAMDLDDTGHLAMTTEAFEESLQRREDEMEASQAIHNGRGYGLQTLEVYQTLADIGEPVKVTEDLWKSVLRLN